MSRGYRRKIVKERIAIRNKAKKIVFRLKHSCLVNCYDLWSVGLFRMVIWTYSRSLLTCYRSFLT